MIERKIGDVFYSQILKKWLKVCEDTGKCLGYWWEDCEKCVCANLECWDEDYNPGECTSDMRKDGKNVHFEETEAPQEGGEQCQQ